MSEFWTDRKRAGSFGEQAGAYEQGRPSYPPEAVAWLLGDARRVADVGAGTGKLTRVVAALGRDVVAVEPDPKLRQALAQAVPVLPVLAGTGEELPLPDAGVEAIVYGQAWHWVEPLAGSREAGRVLTSDGVLGLIWNARNNAVDWVAALTDVMHASAGEVMADAGEPPFGPPFTQVDHQEWHWVREMSRDDVRSMVASRSYVITCPDEERAAIMAGVESVLDSHPSTAGRSTVAMPYRTVAWRLRR